MKAKSHNCHRSLSSCTQTLTVAAASRKHPEAPPQSLLCPFGRPQRDLQHCKASVQLCSSRRRGVATGLWVCPAARWSSGTPSAENDLIQSFYCLVCIPYRKWNRCDIANQHEYCNEAGLLRERLWFIWALIADQAGQHASPGDGAPGWRRDKSLHASEIVSITDISFINCRE